MRTFWLIVIALACLIYFWPKDSRAWICPVDFHDTGTGCVADYPTPYATPYSTPYATPPTATPSHIPSTGGGHSGGTTWCTPTRTTFCRPVDNPEIQKIKEELIRLIHQLIPMLQAEIDKQKAEKPKYFKG